MLKRSEPNNIPNTLKEAIAESMLGNIYQRVSGEGEYGSTVIGNRPSSKFVSGFLEPAYIASRGNSIPDETTNPIHIITLGLDFQANIDNDSSFIVKSKFAIYVRVLPTTDDLKKYKVHLELSAEVKSAIKDAKNRIIREFKDINGDLLKNNKDEYYAQRQRSLDNVTQEVLNRFGVTNYHESLAKQNTIINENDLIISASLNEGESLDIPLEETSSGENEYDTTKDMLFSAYPGMSLTIPDTVMQSVAPLQKWARLEINDMPSITIPVASNSTELNTIIAESNLAMQAAITRRIDDWLQDTNASMGGKLWAFPIGLELTANQIKHWDITLGELRRAFHDTNNQSAFSLPNINIQWQIEVEPQHDNPNIRNIRVALENRTDEERENRTEIEESIFQTCIEVSTKSDNHVALKLDRIKPSYRYNEYLSYPAMGFNNGVTSTENKGTKLFKTTWMPIYAQPRIKPQIYNEINVSFKSLQTYEGTKALRALPQKFKAWIEGTLSTMDPCINVDDPVQKEQEKYKFEDDVRAWKRECEKISKGIELLLASADAYMQNPQDIRGAPFKAWLYMQETMGIVSAKKGFYNWHLFQVAFVLANLPCLVSRMIEFADDAYYDEEWDEAVSLLYFSTGGGKTESFFGLLVFNLFLDRLRGKCTGITAMIRYPLRLLTTQQAQRLAIILAEAERIRWKYEIVGHPFEIGFWVGGANTPNWRREFSEKQVPTFKDLKSETAEEDLLKKPEYVFAKESWNKLPSCPFCNSKTVLRKYAKRNDMIGHACLNALCDWNVKHDGVKKVALPFYIVDEDIYQLAPSVILGTIDKLALIGHSPSTIRRFFGMLGFAPYEDENTQMLITPGSPVEIDRVGATDSMARLSPFFTNGNAFFHDPFPSLIIQDEAHLLEESLGTFSGIFQTTFEQILATLGKHPRMNGIVAKVPGTTEPRMPKIIAASATVTDPDKQMEAIYQRNVFQFPWPGPELYKSFYSAPQKAQGTEAAARADLTNDEEKSHRARFYATLMTNGRPHTSTTVEILGNFHLLITELLLSLNNVDLNIQETARKTLISGIIESKLKSTYIAAIENATFEDLVTLVDLHRISLTYVTNKKGGDQIMAAETDTALKIHEERGIEAFEGLNPELISGAVTAGEIEKVIRRAESRPKPGELMTDICNPDLIRSIVATSAISHGVDVNEFNSMFFAGMPSVVSEYIQASSRIGRTHVGFSLLIPTPQRRRDRYILEINDIYHRFLERLIRPAAVNRWAENALIRSIPSIFQAYLIIIVELQLLLEANDDQKSRVKDYGKLEQINSFIQKTGQKKFNSDMQNFIFDAVGLTHTKYAPSAMDQFKDILRHESVKNIVDDIVSDGHKYTSLGDFFKSMDNRDKEKKRSPMTSLRDVDPLGIISFEKDGSVSVDSTIAYDIMRMISRRGNSKED